MADDEAMIKLLLKVQGEEDVARLNKSIGAQKDLLTNLASSYGGLANAQAHLDPQIKSVTAGLISMNKELQAAQKAAGLMQSGLAGSGQSLLQIGRVVQDFTQGGFGGIINNIEGMTQALGGPAGLAGIMTVVGTAAFIATPFIKDFIKNLGAGDVSIFTTNLEKMEAKLKDLSEHPVKVVLDIYAKQNLEQEIQAEKEGQAAFEAAGKAPTEQEAAAGKAVKEAIGAAPGGEPAIRNQLKAVISEGVEERSPAMENLKGQKAALESGEAGGELTPLGRESAIASVQNAIEGLQLEIRKNTESRVGIMMEGAGKGREDDIKELVEELKNAGRGGLATQIGKAPQALANQKAVESAEWIAIAAKEYKDQAVKFHKEAAEIQKNLYEDQKRISDDVEKVWHEAQQAEKKRYEAQKKAADQREHAVSHQAGRVDQFFQAPVQQSMMQAQARGQNPAEADLMIRSQVEKGLRMTESMHKIPRELQRDVAKNIVQAQRDDLGIQQTGMALAGGMGGGPQLPPGMAMNEKGQIYNKGVSYAEATGVRTPRSVAAAKKKAEKLAIARLPGPAQNALKKVISAKREADKPSDKQEDNTKKLEEATQSLKDLKDSMDKLQQGILLTL